MNPRRGPRNFGIGSMVVLLLACSGGAPETTLPAAAPPPLSAPATPDAADPARGARPATRDEVEQELRARLAARASGTGAVAVLIDASGSATIVTIGTVRAGGPEVTPRTRFEMGSVTKPLVGSLLALLAERGVVGLDDPLSRWVEELRDRPAGALRLQQLATHTAGLPDIVRSWRAVLEAVFSPGDPYARSTTARLLRDLQGWTPDPSAPKGHRYSNLGFALLAIALERAAGVPFDVLMRRELLAPAGAGEAPFARILPTDPDLATPHRGDGSPTPAWSPGAYLGAGGLIASGDEIRNLLLAARDERPPFASGAARPRVLRGAPQTGRASGLGWLRTERHGDRIVWHNGATGGSRSFLGYSEATRRAVALMVNGDVPLDDLGLHVLQPAFALDPTARRGK